MKYALLIGVSDENPEQRLRPGPGLDLLEALLVELGGWTITRVEGPRADRAGILAALDALTAAVGPDDAVLFYFFGHGGVVEILDLPPPLGARPVFYIAAARTGADWSFEAVLDVELSLALARIDAACGNVSVILECCYSARTVRSPVWQLRDSSTWVREVAERTRGCDALLAPDSHPRIVRLTGSSSLRRGYAEAHADGHVGRLTRRFVELVREAGLRIDRLSWDTVAHRAREEVIWQLGCEDQWVTLAGPRDRLLFSREAAEPARTVAFVPREGGPGGWIRAGALQGVKVGDEWGLAELILDDELRPRWRARVRVGAVELNRAAVEPVGEADRSEPPPPGTAAHLLGASERRLIAVEGPAEVRAAVAASSWLHPAAPEDEPNASLAALQLDAAGFELCPRDPELPTMRFAADGAGLAAAIELLEDWARARLLLEIVEAHPPADPPMIEASWRRTDLSRLRGGARSPSSEAGEARLRVGERISFHVRHVGTRGEWFVSAVEIGVDGRPTLLNASEPEGHELRPRDTVELGRRRHRRHDGFELRWPVGVPADRPRPVTVLLLASPRPIQLGHLARDASADHLPRFEHGRRRARVRRHLDEPRARRGPEPIRAWSWQILRYQLEPHPLETQE